jgi:hypothetical protein
MARINWKKKYEDMTICQEVAQNGWNRCETTMKKVNSVLKGQLTSTKKKLAESIPADVHNATVAELRSEISKMQKEVTKSAEARELVELLEWAKSSQYQIQGWRGYAVYDFDDDDNKILLTENHPTLLAALRAAKKAVEEGK